MTHKGTVRLETDRLVLRRFTIVDLEPMFYNCRSEHDVRKWTKHKRMTEAVQAVLQFFSCEVVKWNSDLCLSAVRAKIRHPAE